MPELNETDLNAIKSPDIADVTAAKVFSGKVFPPQQHLLLFNSEDWEAFIREWAQFQKNHYELVAQVGGAFDFGIDVACFCTTDGFAGDWDNFQCKYYKGAPLAPNTAIPEIGKVLWHAFTKKISLPRHYYFFAPKDCGPSLKKLLLDSDKLKSKLKERWNEWCAAEITGTQIVELQGEFLQFVESADFSRFKYKPTHDVIEEHRKTPFFIQRFGGGLPDRPATGSPPIKIIDEEFRYVEQLFAAYSDKEKTEIRSETLTSFIRLEKHFHRQREAFFHAEALRVFARDTVPAGTFESLQDEIYSGVIDLCDQDHENGFERLSSVTARATSLNLTANGLIQVTKTQDRRGICHQLANEDRLIWVQSND